MSGHQWTIDSLVGSIRNPIILKCSCEKCDAKLVVVCGVKLYDPDGPVPEQPPPCTSKDVGPG